MCYLYDDIYPPGAFACATSVPIYHIVGCEPIACSWTHEHPNHWLRVFAEMPKELDSNSCLALVSSPRLYVTCPEPWHSARGRYPYCPRINEHAALRPKCERPPSCRSSGRQHGRRSLNPGRLSDYFHPYSSCIHHRASVSRGRYVYDSQNA